MLDVTPEWLLSGVDPAAGRVKNREFYVVDLDTDSGKLIMEFNKLDKTSRDKILGYVEAFVSMQPEKDRKGNE